jgi:hypothetical protein
MNLLAPLDIIAAHPWKRALFTTYALGASFTEAVVVEALLRRGVEHITILSDAAGMRMALREEGAVRIGREYSLEPVTVRNGCFHPKIGVLWSEDRSHVLVGSGNLTFGGWSSNLECLDHLHTAGCARALSGVADFLLDLATTPRCLHAAESACEDFAERLHAAAQEATEDGRVTLVHSLSASISSQLVEGAAELGGAERLIVAAPFWSDVAIDRLASALGLGEYFAHYQDAVVLGPTGTDWPRSSPIARPVRIHELSENEGGAPSIPPRPLHAKLFEIACKNGRLVLSGSANATAAALESDADSVSGNIEVGILRRFPVPNKGWTLSPVLKPKARTTHPEEQEDKNDNFALLSAQLAAGVLKVTILARWDDISVSAELRQPHSSHDLGRVQVRHSCFEVELGDDADLLSLSGRMVLRLVSDNGAIAEGFVVEPGVDAIRKRAGKALLPMLAALKQLHTPEDVLALLVFYRENPDAFRTADPFSSRGRPGSSCRADPLVTVEQLRTSRLHASDGDGSSPNSATADQIEWQRLMQRLVAAMSRAKPPTESDEDDQDTAERKRRERTAASAGKLNMRFPGFFQEFAEGVEDEAAFLNLARITNFVCVSADHPMTREFIEQLLRLAASVSLSRAGQQVAAWLTLYAALASTDALAVPTARARLLSLGLDPDDELDDDYSLPGMAEVVAPDSDSGALLTAIRSTRTIHEEAAALERALEAGLPLPEVPALTNSEHWPVIQRQLQRAPERRKLWFSNDPLTGCPWCHMELLRHLKSELARTGVTQSCCGSILVKGHDVAHH